jgi:hypothetical protein
MNKIQIGLLAGLLTASSLAFSIDRIDFRHTTAQVQGCTLSKGDSNLPVVLFTKHVDWYKYNPGNRSRMYFCHFKVPKKYRHLIEEGVVDHHTPCRSLDATDDTAESQSTVYLNKAKIGVRCSVYDADPDQ